MSDEPDVCNCGKKQYGSRKTAKIAARKSFPGEHLSPYRCGNGWHIGHLPARVIAGDKARGDIDRNRPSPKRERIQLKGLRTSNFGVNRAQRHGKPRTEDDYEEDE